MSTSSWQLETPISAIIFDCDGTLSTIEGINELARMSGVHHEVELLTAIAMGKTGINPDIFEKRLALVCPTHEQILNLGHLYFANQVPHARMVIELFKRLHKTVYIVSAGLNPAVTLFGELLNIPRANIFAVNVAFDPDGNFMDFERKSPLIYNDGKRIIVSELKKQHEHLIHIGDGLNDYVTHDIVTRFVGYGGIYYREHIANRCEYYINTPSLTPLLSLSLTEDEYNQLLPEEKSLYHTGLTAMNGWN